MKIMLFCFSALLSSGWPYVHAAELANDEQKELYALGVAISQSLGDFALGRPGESIRLIKERSNKMDNVSLIRIIAGIGFVVVLLILIQRRRSRVS